MTVEDNFPVPPGDPTRVLAAADALRRTAERLTGSGRKVAAERAGMAAVWSGDAGSAAAYETGKAGDVTADYAGRVGEGGAALTEYGKALDEAITGVNGIRAQARRAYADAWHEVNRDRTVPPSERPSEVDGLVGPTLRGLGIQYHYVVDGLRAPEEKAAGALTGLVPFYWPGMQGMKPELLTELARASVASGLPMLQRADGERVGNALADKVKPYLDQGKRIPDDLLAEIERNRLNPWFAKTFLERLGPRAPGWTIDVMRYNNTTPPEYNQRVITMFGQLLALGTRTTGPARLSDKYLDDLLAPLQQRDQAGLAYARVLACLMHFGGQFGRPFLNRYGDKLYEIDKSQDGLFSFEQVWMMRPRVPEYAPDDPRVTYFDQLAGDPDAAQDFFLHSDRVHYYAGPHQGDNYYLEDEGETLGKALQAATTVYRNADQTGKRSADIAADLVHTLAAAPHAWPSDNWRADMLPSIATILNSYADDVFYSLSGADYGGATDTTARFGQPELGTKDRWGVDFNVNDLRATLAQVDHNTEAYKKIVSAQLAASRLYLADKLGEARGADQATRDDLLMLYGRSHGLVLQQLFGVHMDTQTEMGKLKDNKQQEGVWTADAVVASILDIGAAVPLIGAPVAAFKVGRRIWLADSYINALEDSEQDKANAAALNTIDQWYSAVLNGIVVDMQNDGGFAGTPADATTWLHKHGFGADAQFVDGSGHVLKTMTPAQQAAYNEWLKDPNRDGVKLKLVKMFTALDAAGEKQGK